MGLKSEIKSVVKRWRVRWRGLKMHQAKSTENHPPPPFHGRQSRSPLRDGATKKGGLMKNNDSCTGNKCRMTTKNLNWAKKKCKEAPSVLLQIKPSTKLKSTTWYYHKKIPLKNYKLLIGRHWAIQAHKLNVHGVCGSRDILTINICSNHCEKYH